MAPKGVSNRTLLAKKKGIRTGQTIVCTYREEGKGTPVIYEGVLADRRIGGTDRESFCELRDCKQLNAANEILKHEGTKRLVDAFITHMDIAEPRPEGEVSAAVAAAPTCEFQPAEGCCGMQPAMMQQGMMPGVGMGAAMPTNVVPMGASPGMQMGMAPMGMGPMGMGVPMGFGGGMMPMGIGMGMMPMGMMGMGMGMMPMGMGMMPNMGMGMMASGMGGCANMGGCAGMGGGMMAGMPGAGAMQMAAMAGGAPAEGGKDPGAGAHAAAATLPAAQGDPEACPAMDVNAAIENIEEGDHVRVVYSHPQLGKTTYSGILAEKYIGGSFLQSFIQLNDCKRLGRRGHVREREATKRFMNAFIDEVRAEEAPSPERERRRSRSPRGKPRDRPQSRGPGEESERKPPAAPGDGDAAAADPPGPDTEGGG